MRRWLGGLFRWLWLVIETGGQRRHDRPYLPDPFRDRLGLVTMGGHVVTRISRDDLDTLAALVDPTRGPDTLENAHTGELTIRVPGGRMAERLDLLGINEHVARGAFLDHMRDSVAFLNERLADPESTSNPEIYTEERSFYEHFTVDEWLTRIRAAATSATGTEPDRFFIYPQPNNFWWLHHTVQRLESRAAIRLNLLAFPHADVTVRLRASDDLTLARLATVSADARHTLRTRDAAFLPLIVLTEGSSDAHMLRGALELLLPHLKDLVQFLDFDALPGSRATGGKKDIAPKIRTLLGSGIKQRIVAVYDNDLAGRTELANLLTHRLPTEVVATCYPDLHLARTYPAHNLPGHGDEQAIVEMDVNGSAAALELYLGRDSLTNPDTGDLYPIEWTHESREGIYQGTLAPRHKNAVHQHFRSKLAAAQEHGTGLPGQDWSGVQQLLTHILDPNRTTPPT